MDALFRFLIPGLLLTGMQADGERMKHTELAGAGHGFTGIVYPRADLHEWLFQQKKRAMSAN